MNDEDGSVLCESCGQTLPDYEDVPASTLGSLKKFERLERFNRRKIPKIRWGATFLSWSWKRKAEWAMKVANAYNHATDLIQQERDKLREVCEAFEVKVAHVTKAYEQQTALFNAEMANKDRENQETIQALLKEKDRSKRQAKEILRLREKAGEPLRQPKTP